MASTKSDTNPGVALGVVIGVIGALYAYNAHGGSSAIAAGVAGFLLGVAIVRFIGVAILFAFASLALYFAWNRFIASTEPASPEIEITALIPEPSPAPLPSSQPTFTPEASPPPPAVPTPFSKFVTVRNGCEKELHLFARWNQPGIGWRVNLRPWTIPARSTASLHDDGTGIRTALPEMYAYAWIEQPNGATWPGEAMVRINGQDLPMKLRSLEIQDEEARLEFACVSDADREAAKRGWQ